MSHRVELLAPAGNTESFYGAINAGADAVYLAGNSYGARAYADNFSQEDLLECLRYAHLFQKKIYLTVNTLMKQEELDKLPDFLDPLVKCGLDGVIVQDFGALGKIHECFPQLPLHASTQMNITGVNGAKFLKDFHVVRIVPARELTLAEIKVLSRDSGMEIECFIHGAMCYCYSGQCLFSSILGGRSGNRGRCAQPCRLPYQISLKHEQETSGNVTKKGKDIYPLSLKDMCTLEILPQLIEAGIGSFKIEGRMKKAEYAAGVTAIYRKYIDLYYDGRYKKPSLEDMDYLRKLYIRTETGHGYYERHNGRDMITLNSPSYTGSDDKQLERIRAQYLERKKRLDIIMQGIFRLNAPAQLRIALDQNTPIWVTVYGSIVEPASQSPISRENIIKQLSKLGESSFQLSTRKDEPPIELELDDGAFYSLKLLNELRRAAVNALEEELNGGDMDE